MMGVRTGKILKVIKIYAALSVAYVVMIQSSILSTGQDDNFQTSMEPNKDHDNAMKTSSKTWIPKSLWDAPPEGFYSGNETGSFQNCIPDKKDLGVQTQSFNLNPEQNSGTIAVSCHPVRFRATYSKIQNVGDIIVGVLSAASGSGPERRSYIRSTWGHTHDGSTFFLVAGPWEDVKDEFTKYGDLIWIDEEEVYQGEKSVLTFKTISYFAIAHLFGRTVEDGGWMHAIKTDDDSYVNVRRLKEKLTADDGEYRDLHYYGQCPQFQVLPSRDRESKWPVTYQTYPEPKFPLYCQGAGFGLSRELVKTAVDEKHVSMLRYMPFEDVSVGILAERSGGERFHATMISGVKVFRADTPKERKCVNYAVPMSKCYEGDDTWPPDAQMGTKLIQHRVDGQEDMITIHKSLGLEVKRSI